MKKTAHTLLYCFVLLLVLSCRSTKQLSNVNPYHPKLIQGKQTFILKEPINFIEIKREAFRLHFFAEFYRTTEGVFRATQIASFTEKADWANFGEGQSVSDIPYFSFGTGLAAPRGKQYDSMYLTNTGHHYILYEKEGTKRANLVKNFADGMMELSWEVNRFFKEGDFISFRDFAQDTVYLIIFYDKNSNEIVDQGEYYRVALTFI